MRRVIECYNAEKLPYAGGLYDQPASFVSDHLYLLGQMAEKQAADDAEREAEAKAAQLAAMQGA